METRSSYCVVALIAVMLVCTACLHLGDNTQTVDFTTSGRVLLPDGRTPLKNTTIELIDMRSPLFSLGPSRGPTFGVTTTDIAGRFSFRVPSSRALRNADLVIFLAGAVGNYVSILPLEDEGKTYVIRRPSSASVEH